ncbi:MAG: ornithine carbamoyltransferase [Chloroflexi bacterium]|nr:ornithine carbamoyltransferase [Chloroflexota bacterium]
MKHFVSLSDLTPQEVQKLLALASRLKEEWRMGGNSPLLAGKTLGMIFQKPSLRTRVSFEVGMGQLGGRALYLSPQEVQMGQREPVADVARVLSRYVDIILARVFAHADIEELAARARVPVINALSDYSHPCQGLSDLFTIHEKFGRLKGLKLAYVGDGNNVAHSLLFASGLVGMDISVATPRGFEPHAKAQDRAKELAQASGSRMEITNDPLVAVQGADVIYTDVWTSMGQEEEREKRKPIFTLYQINRQLLEKSEGQPLVMHPLPAHRGEEITSEILEGPLSIVYDQAENRMHLQKAILVGLLRPEEL